MSDKQKVFKALRDPNGDWRTMDGLKKDTGLSQDQIIKVLVTHLSKIDMLQSKEHGILFRLKTRATNQKEEPFLDKALDYLTLGKRKNVA